MSIDQIHIREAIEADIPATFKIRSTDDNCPTPRIPAYEVRPTTLNRQRGLQGLR